MEPKNKLLLLVAFRLVIVSALLGLAAGTGLLVPHISYIRLLLALSALSLLFALLLRYSEQETMVFYLGLILDIGLVSFLVSATGVIDSLFTSLYLPIIVYASMLRGRRDGIAAAVLSVIGYFALVGLARLGLVPSPFKDAGLEIIGPKIALNLLGFIAVAYLGVSLSARLKMARSELEAEKISRANLQALNDNIVNCIRTGLLTTDLAGKITTANAAAAEIMGYKRGLAGIHVTEIIGEEFWRRIRQTDFTRERRAVRSDRWARTRSGAEIYLGFSVSPLITHSGEQIGHIISFQDLTDIKRLEEEIQLKEKMAALGKMAAGIAHELRNPLASIRGSIQLLGSELKLRGEQARLMRIVLRESDRLNKIIEDFLTYARPTRLNTIEIQISDLLAETVELVKHTPMVKPAHRIEFTAENGCAIEGDRDRLKQVFWNLASNALKAMPEGGLLSIEARRVGRNQVRVSFTDTGIGMSQEEIDNIFEPFFSRFQEGVGLGMAIVYQIVDAHKGRIQVRSKKGVGTTVTLELPAVLKD